MSSVTSGDVAMDRKQEIFLDMLSQFSGKPVSEIDLEKDTFESLNINQLDFCDKLVFRTGEGVIIQDFSRPVGVIMGVVKPRIRGREDYWALLGPAISQLTGKDVSEIKESDRLWDLGLRPGAATPLCVALRTSVRISDWDKDTVKDILDRLCAH